MLKFSLLIMLFTANLQAQDIKAYKETETCTSYHKLYNYTNYDNGKYNDRVLEESTSRFEYQRTIIEEGNKTTIYEEQQSYSPLDGPVTSKHSKKYENKKVNLEDGKYKIVSEYTYTYHPMSSNRGPVDLGVMTSTTTYQQYPDGSIEAIEFIDHEGDVHTVDENIQYTKPDGLTYKITISENDTSQTDFWKIDTVYLMTVCKIRKLD